MNLKITFVTVLMCYFTFPMFSQHDKLGTRFPQGVTEATYYLRSAEGGKVEKSRVDPPFWWIGMENPVLQLLIYDQEVAACESVDISHPGISVENIQRLENANYLFVDLMIGPGTSAGTFEITLGCGTEQRSLSYELKSKSHTDGHPNGVDASDLIYLIMPDRFANGNPNNDILEDMRQTGIDRENVFFRHGGDLIGIMEHLDYLEELGVTALWLNPVIENDQPYESYHGYAPTDHYRIDPRYGTNEQYQQLVRLCHERGIKVIMDIIHNHVGDQHWFIRDLPSRDWIHQPDTFIKTTYRAPTLMDPYASKADKARMLDGWFDNHMPDLNQRNPFVANYLIQNNLWWMEFSGQDGFRIDTYAYNDQEFMAEWGARMKEEYPEMSSFGETWVHGTAVQAQFTQNNDLRKGWNSNLPGVTDYQMYYAMLEALQQEQGWTSGITRLYYTLAQDFLYEDPYRNVLFLDNHDLGRIFSVLEEDTNDFRSGMALLMTLRGIPMIYYGTEILMTGVGGAFGEAGRQDFPGGWSDDETNKFKKKGRTKAEQEAFEYVSKLANYRKDNPVLHQGKLIQYVPEDGIYVYFRYNGAKSVMVLYNSNEEDKKVPTQRYHENLQGYQSALNIITGQSINELEKITVPGKTAIVLELQP
jgi:glycosidase